MVHREARRVYTTFSGGDTRTDIWFTINGRDWHRAARTKDYRRARWTKHTNLRSSRWHDQYSRNAHSAVSDEVAEKCECGREPKMEYSVLVKGGILGAYWIECGDCGSKGPTSITVAGAIWHWNYIIRER